MLKLRVRSPAHPAPQLVELPLDYPWSAVLLQLSSTTGIDESNIRVLKGFPPKPIECDGATPLSELGVRENEMLVVQEGGPRMQVVNTGERYAQPANERAHFRRRSCPADNSCLFHACAYILKDKNRTDGPKLRMQCVEYVLHHPKIYTEAGEDPMKYASWLAQPNTWGGYMEMVALSEMHQVEIIALDLESTTIIRCGENKNYPLRGYVVFTGNHYDAIAMSTSTNLTDESQDQVLFNPRDEAVFQKAVDFVKEEGRKGR